MGDISVIARRLSDKYVQYGWCGNGGVFSSRGIRLWEDYNTPEMVEYLFSLGQLRSLWSPGSEKTSYLFRTEPTGDPYWVGTSELDIYSKIAFVDHAYFYDSDNQWYYIVPAIMWTKAPISLLVAHLTERGDILPEFRIALETAAFDAVLNYYRNDEQYRAYVARLGYDDNRMDQLGQEIKNSGDKLFYYNNCELLETLKNLYRYFALWAVVSGDESGREIGRVLLRAKSEPYIETIFWT